MAGINFVNGEFINLYSKDNPILEANDICYYLVFNNTDFHRPLIGMGHVIIDKFSDGMNKHYFVHHKQFIEPQHIVDEFFFNKQFDTFPYDESTSSMGARKLQVGNKKFDFQKYTFKIESFFIRNSHEKIVSLRNEYISIIRDDVEKMLSDIDNINLNL